jgi:hypothetical protein
MFGKAAEHSTLAACAARNLLISAALFEVQAFSAQILPCRKMKNY